MKWIHIIGVCGKATSLVAKMFADMGWFVTGSDAQFFPPASTYLQEQKIHTAEGYSYIHLTKKYWQEQTNNPMLDVADLPDVCIMMSFLTEKNKEFRYAKINKIPVLPYAKILGEYLIKENSIVVVGSAGKTTTTGLIAFLLESLSLDVSYMVGAETNNLEDSIKNVVNGIWSVVEGDEYHNLNPNIEGRAKFLEYKPKYLVITNIGYEHQDIFPTQEDYLGAFEQLVELVPSDGLIIAKSNDKNIDRVIQGAKCKVLRYGSNQAITSNYYVTYSHSEENGAGYVLLDEHRSEIISGKMKMLDFYNAENVLAAYVLLEYLYSNKIIKLSFATKQDLSHEFAKLVEKFGGVKKRLEILYSSSDLVVIDDFGVVADRAQRSLTTIKQHYPEHEIIAVFEPNSASRVKNLEDFNVMYKDIFRYASFLFIPRLSEDSNLASETEMIERLNQLSYNAQAIERETAIDSLNNLIKGNKEKKFVVVFFSSYRFTQTAHNFASSQSAKKTF